MLTFCPKCTLSLAVTAADLRLGQGYVRCGRCATVFNALLALTDSEGDDLGATQAHQVLTLPEDSANDPAAQNADDQPSDDVSATATNINIVLEGNEVTQHEDLLEVESIDAGYTTATRRILAEHDADEDIEIDTSEFERLLLPTAAAPTPAAAREPNDALSATQLAPRPRFDPPVDDDLDAAPKSDAARSIWWIGAAALLALALGLQLVHHWRNDLAVRDDWIGGGLTRTYQALQLPLSPNWDLRGYDFRQLGAVVSGGGDNVFHIGVSLANRAARSQPFPILRLTFFDRYGKRVGTRDLQPAEYLTAAQVKNTFMQVSQRIDTELSVMDPGRDSSSFELDICLKSGANLRCANDLPTAASL